VGISIHVMLYTKLDLAQTVNVISMYVKELRNEY